MPGSVMRTLRAGILTAALLLAAAAPAWADALSVTADVPIVYTFKESSLKDTSPRGLLVGVSLPSLLGVGLEAYKVTGKIANPTPPDTEFEYKVTMLDAYLDVPFPAANLVLGVGLGKGRFATVPATVPFSDAGLAQAFFSVGVPFGGAFDAHVGYRVIRGEANVGTSGKVNLDARMATIGLKMGF